MEYEKMCRACLSTELKLFPMDQDSIEKYNLLTNLNVTLTGVPLYICSTCLEGIQFCIDFRDRCIASDLTLKNIKSLKSEIIHTEATIDINEEKFTTEVELKIEYDDDKPIVKIKKVRSRRKKIVVLPTPSDSELLCGLCPNTLKGEKKLAEHLDRHKIDVSCGLCPQRFLNLPHMLAHRMEHVPKEQKTCHLCTKKIISCENLEFHYMRVHEMAEKNAGIQCKICSKEFPTIRKLRAHSVGHRDTKYQCDHCELSFRTKSNIRTHVAKHSEPTLKCEFCEELFKYSANLRSHQLYKHNNNKVHCKKCRNTYRSAELFEKHNCKVNIVVCTVCGANVVRRVLKRHMRQHEDVYPYKCDICPEKFKGQRLYSIHMDKHNGKPRYKCEYCDRTFYWGSVLIKHRRTHTGEKPYVCEICDRGFTGKHNLKIHMKIHGIYLVKSKNSTEESTDL